MLAQSFGIFVPLLYMERQQPCGGVQTRLGQPLSPPPARLMDRNKLSINSDVSYKKRGFSDSFLPSTPAFVICHLAPGGEKGGGCCVVKWEVDNPPILGGVPRPKWMTTICLTLTLALSRWWWWWFSLCDESSQQHKHAVADISPAPKKSLSGNCFNVPYHHSCTHILL